MDWKEVYEFWFDPRNKAFRFVKDDDFDNLLRERFLKTWQLGREGLLNSWRDSLKGRLCEIIVLDQFSRNLCRGRSCAFEQDKMALVLAQEAMKDPEFENLSADEKRFILMPFMHSESRKIHEMAMELFVKWTDEVTLDYEHKHKRIIDRFGRYPHRNIMLKRMTTAEEMEFLKEPGSRF